VYSRVKYVAIVLLLAQIVLIACSRKVAPTFEKDVAGIIYSKCTKCHNPNGVAPFSLTSFDNIKKRAKTIAFVTKNRIMPPWWRTGFKR
jgi:hypothetical protein